jgi:hypothetical protein
MDCKYEPGCPLTDKNGSCVMIDSCPHREEEVPDEKKEG